MHDKIKKSSNYFNFDDYKQTSSIKKPFDKEFLEFFVGFTEGDGSFIVSSDKYDKQRCFFIITQKDPRILYYIRGKLGFGTVSFYKTYSRYIVAGTKSNENIHKLINIFNGNLILDKTNSRFITWLTAANIEGVEYKGSLELDSFNDNGWLAGFTSADGHFSVSKIIDKRYSLGYRVRLRFILDQKGELSFFSNLKRNFLPTSHVGTRNSSKDMFRFTCTHLLDLSKIIEYFDRYSLRSSKTIDYVRFKKIYNYMITRKSLPWEGKVLKRIERLLIFLDKDF